MVLTKRTKVEMIQQNYNMIDEINFRAEAKRFTHKTIQKILRGGGGGVSEWTGVCHFGS